MVMCNTEIIKKVKELEGQKRELLDFERRNLKSSYIDEKDKIETGYDYNRTRECIRNINRQIRYLKNALNKTNAKIIVEGFNMTIGECIVYLAQLNCEKDVLENMCRENPKTRQTTYNGESEYTVLNYNLDICRENLTNIKNTIYKLQIAIDRTNLNNEIDITM